MGLYRDEEGTLIEVDDRFAAARGYAPVGVEEGYGGELTQAAAEQRGEDRGALGTANAFLTEAASSLTLGGSNYLLGETLSPQQRERLVAELEANPIAATAGAVTGAVAGGFAAPGSALARTPAGYLGANASLGVERALAQGGVKGTAKALGVMGTEGAAQGVGQYIGHAAIEDKEATVEGLAGAVGTGFAFGAAGGGAALGVVKGAIATRRMFSRVMDGQQAAKQAESAWTLARQEALDSDAATAQAAQTKLDEIRKAKIEAMRARNEARAMTREEQLRAQTATPRVTEDGTPATGFEGPIPLDEGIAPATGGGVTSKFSRPDVKFDPNDAAAFDAGMPPLRDQVNDVARTVEPVETGAKTGAFKRPDGATKRIVAQADEPATDLERQLAGTKAKLDEGASIKDVAPAPAPKAGKGNESPSIENWLREKKAFDDADLSAANRIEDLRGGAALRMERLEALSEIRFKATEDLLGPQMAKMEREIVDAMDEFDEARKALDDISDGVPLPVDVPNRRTFAESDGVPVIDVYGVEGGLKRVGPADKTRNVAKGAGRRQAVEMLDSAHEEALLRAKYAADPQEAGRALEEAAELERLLDDTISDGVPRQYATDELGYELVNAIQKIHRYEQASAKLSDVLGDQAHMTSVMRAKALRDAEKDSMRKVMDRAARAVDDTEFGPAYKTPKERVAYAKQQQNAAQNNLDELGVQEREAGDALKGANKKLRASERDKKAALRADAKLGAQANRFGAQDAGGIMEIADIPGIPKPSDLPIVGPLLGAWLKFRTLKRALGRMGGKVPATPEAKVAAKAAQTRDRIARAVDRSLGLAEKGGKFASRKIPQAAAVLGHRIFDNGEEDLPKGAPITKLAGLRMRELTAYVTTPGAIERDVRIAMRDVTDPDLIEAAEKHRRAAMEFALKNLPPVPEQGILKTLDWEPSPAQAMSFARTWDALNDPSGVFERLAHEQDMISLEAAEALRNVYPKLFGQAQQRMLERAGEVGTKIPTRTRIQMTLLYKLPVDSAYDPVNFQITQSVYDRKVPIPAPNAAQPPQPALANPVNISQEMTPALDRR